jgi:hypothetical protein
MTLCPYAIVAGCEKCPILKVCPLKSVIGNQPKKTDRSSKKTDQE